MAVPISFVSEHIETLEEIDLEYRELALECGVRHWERAPALNTDPAFIADLADLVVSTCTATTTTTTVAVLMLLLVIVALLLQVEALHKPTLTVAEATSQRYSETVLLAPQPETSPQ